MRALTGQDQACAAFARPGRTRIARVRFIVGWIARSFGDRLLSGTCVQELRIRVYAYCAGWGRTLLHQVWMGDCCDV